MLPTVYQQFIHQSRYARWLEGENRRETWDETVARYIQFMTNHLLSRDVDPETVRNIAINCELAIRKLEVMPSMRALMTSGPALARDNIAGFNCSYLPIDHPRAFDEALYILLCGTGVGYSVERQQIAKLPEIPDHFEDGSPVVVDDSKMGWAMAIRETIAMLYAGVIPNHLDTSSVRPAGERLKTFGGRASGPAPLQDLYQFIVQSFTKAKGRRLNSVEVSDIVCKIGEAVVVGGVRRSALICLTNLSDQRMRDSKSGQWWESEPQRRLANISVAYTEKPDVGQWMEEWMSIYSSKSGERGIFNRQAVIKQCRKIERKTEMAISTDPGNDQPYEFGTNPCGEIILRPYQFCNLTEGVARAGDTEEDLFRKVRIATILGTYQSTLTDFTYLRDIWKKNSEEERLLGVSITGIMDCELLSHDSGSRAALLMQLKDYARETNKKYAAIFGVNESAAITCVKPSGTVSQLTNASSGIHTRFAPSYIRRARNDAKDPLTQFMIDQGVPCEADKFAPGTKVFSFPIDSPQDAVTRRDRTAIEELENWLAYKVHWCEHNPSVTINVREHEWPQVGAWVWDHFDQVAGLSFLPHDDHIYQQAPYEEVSPDRLAEVQAVTPTRIDWTKHVETDDETVSSQEPACTAGTCSI